MTRASRRRELRLAAELPMRPYGRRIAPARARLRSQGGAWVSLRHDHALPGSELACGSSTSSSGSMGVFVVCRARPTRLARFQQTQDLRRDLRALRAVLDAAGLRALRAGGLLGHAVADGRPLRFTNDTGIGDVAAVLEYLGSDRLHCPLVVRSALVASTPPPFIADVRPERSTRTRVGHPAVAATI